MPKPKRGEAGFLSKQERQKLQMLYTQIGAFYGSLHNIVEATNLPISELGQLLHSKTSYTNFTLPTRKFKRLKALASLKIESWCMDISDVDKLAKDNDGVNY